MLAPGAGAPAKREEAVTKLFQSRGDLRKRSSRLPRDVANMRTDGAQAQRPDLRGLLLPQEPPLRPGAERGLRDLPPEPTRGPRPTTPARASHAGAPLGLAPRI